MEGGLDGAWADVEGKMAPVVLDKDQPYLGETAQVEAEGEAKEVKIPQGRSIAATRIGIIVGIIIAVVISYYSRGGYIIARATAIFFGLCASAFLPAFIGGLFFRRVTKAGAIASMTVIVVSLLTRPMDKPWVNYVFGGPKPGSEQ